MHIVQGTIYMSIYGHINGLYKKRVHFYFNFIFSSTLNELCSKYSFETTQNVNISLDFEQKLSFSQFQKLVASTLHIATTLYVTMFILLNFDQSLMYEWLLWGTDVHT